MSWDAEELLRDPSARPPEDDLAGAARFFAWEWVDANGDDCLPWGEGRGQYGGGCRAQTFLALADEIDRLQGLLAQVERDGPAAAFVRAYAAKVEAGGTKVNPLEYPLDVREPLVSALRAVAGMLAAGFACEAVAS